MDHPPFFFSNPFRCALGTEPYEHLIYSNPFPIPLLSLSNVCFREVLLPDSCQRYIVPVIM